MPSLGNVVVFSLLSNMTELGYITNKEESALVGVAPINRKTGSFKDKRIYAVDDIKYEQQCSC